MKLYHYTTFTNFCSIWIQQKLKFSEWTNCNDIFERQKILNFTQSSKEFNGKVCPPNIFKMFVSDVFEEIQKFKQVSFTKDYRDGIEGFASPMMWGHYARDYQRSGICIELDASKIKMPKQVKIYKRGISYKKSLIATHVGGVDAEMDNAAEIFVKNNIYQLFFQKHFHWKFENEYRFICKAKDISLDITDAITSVYVLGEDDITLQSVKRIITDTERISFINVGGLKTLKLKSTNLFDFETVIEEMKYLSSHSGI